MNVLPHAVNGDRARYEKLKTWLRDNEVRLAEATLSDDFRLSHHALALYPALPGGCLAYGPGCFSKTDPASPVYVLGDTHGDFETCLAIFDTVRKIAAENGETNPVVYLLGDILDRNEEGCMLECALLLAIVQRALPDEFSDLNSLRLGIIKGDHDVGLVYDEPYAPEKRFKAGVNPADYCDWLNKRLDAGGGEDATKIGRAWIRLMKVCPAAAFLEETGTLLAHGGIPREDLQKQFAEGAPFLLQSPEFAQDFAWCRLVDARRKLLNRGSKTCEIGGNEFNSFCKTVFPAKSTDGVPGTKVKRFLFGHQHPTKGVEQYTRWYDGYEVVCLASYRDDTALGGPTIPHVARLAPVADAEKPAELNTSRPVDESLCVYSVKLSFEPETPPSDPQGGDSSDTPPSPSDSPAASEESSVSSVEPNNSPSESPTPPDETPAGDEGAVSSPPESPTPPDETPAGDEGVVSPPPESPTPPDETPKDAGEPGGLGPKPTDAAKSQDSHAKPDNRADAADSPTQKKSPESAARSDRKTGGNSYQWYTFVRRRMQGWSHLAQLLLLVGLVFSGLWIFGWLMRPFVYGPDGHAQTLKELLFGLLGAIDAKPEAGWGSVGYSALVRFLGAVVFGGVITSFLCARVDKYAEKRKRGVIVPILRNHFVVIGYSTMTDDLIRVLLDPSRADDLAKWVPQERIAEKNWTKDVRRRKVLLCTGGDVEKIRETLDTVLPRKISRRIVYAFCDMNPGSGLDEMCEQLCLKDARQIFVIGDENTVSAGDIMNLAFAKGIGDYLARHAPKRPAAFPKPVFVRLDGGASFDFVKKISFETDPTSGKSIAEVTSFFKPFSFTEGWARRIWGDATATADGSAGAPDAGALDFAPLTPEKSVHLVVAGLTPMGEALVLHAVRVCHFPNGDPTLITIVDPDKSAESAFHARHPSLRSALDVKIEFLHERIESEEARELLRQSAMDEKRLLSVAVCFRHSDAALSAALNLPEEVYWHRLKGGKKDIRNAYRENGARIWVLQEHRNGLSERAEHQPRYGLLRPFGMQEGGFTPWCLREFCAMYLNAAYDWPNEEGASSWLDGCTVPSVAEEISEFRKTWAEYLPPVNPYGVFEINATEKKNLLLSILKAGGEDEVRRFQEYAFRKYILLKPALRWANLYVSDFYGVIFRALGLRAVYDRDTPFADLAQANDQLFAERREATRPAFDKDKNPLPGHFVRSLAEVEHNRWMADRALMGYRAPRPGTGETRDDDFRYHNDMIPFSKLSETEQGKDDVSIACIPLFMALEGIRLERATGAPGVV